jgi:hypothetical protein
MVAGRAVMKQLNSHLISGKKLPSIASLECLRKAFDTRPQQ